MNTWSFKAPLAAISLTVLAACEGGPGGNPFAAALGSEPKPLSQADMARGKVTLVAPRGFCIDSASLKDRFALMARCDRLGAPSAAGAAPLGVITVSVSDASPGGALPDPQTIGAAHGLTAVSAVTREDDSVIFRATGPAPTDELDGTHWRATALVNGQMLGVALYGPKGAADVQDEGRDVISALIARTRGGA
ncbi:hypothetical protein BOO69_16985 [Sulfitobacter alexandrii]|uniref:Dihydroxy-acid dehydratase n=1 Tax=Sulfitobacter alexandrii TaxID=1917485 RepID=A0A1J0WL72_9RHOB|nr:hypothetical protein [Sulfitobacter alexandrii]APE44912.1 hypothetical protein BOO69_16985 [Sulfitobacter alexandrii]